MKALYGLTTNMNRASATNNKESTALRDGPVGDHRVTHVDSQRVEVGLPADRPDHRRDDVLDERGDDGGEGHAEHEAHCNVDETAF